MAEEALKKIKEGLNCSICLDTYTDPKLLQCFHVYCQQCLVPLVHQDQHGKLGITCPTCRQVAPIPDRGVSGLQPAFHINHLLEIQDSVKKLDIPAAAVERGFAAPSKDVARHCIEHRADEVKLYCKTCGELLCYKCVIKGSKHHSHDYKELDQAFQEYKEEITSFLEPTMERQLTAMKNARARIDTYCREVPNQQAATKEKIRVTFVRLRESLDDRETELISNLNQMTQDKLKGLAVQRDQLEFALAQLDSSLHFVQDSLRIGNKEDMLAMKRSAVLQVVELTSSFAQVSLEPCTEADIVFSSLPDITDVHQDYGKLLALGLPDPSKCYATWKGVELAAVESAEVVAVEKNTTFVLHCLNFNGKPCEERIKSLETELVSEIAGVRTRCRVQSRGEGRYKISYGPTIKGWHQLHIKVEDQHIRGSPYPVAVKSPVRELKGTPVLTVGGVEGPVGVAVTQGREVVVTEWGGHCISVFSPSGEKLRSFGTRGLTYPDGLALDGDDNILVVDGNHGISKFTTDGQLLASVYMPSKTIAFNASNGKVYVVDTGEAVQVLNPDLTFSGTFGRPGSSEGQFYQADGIACDSIGKVFVADSGNRRIQVFTAEGEFLRTFRGRGQLDWSTGIAIDSNDMVYVSDRGNNRISVFTSEGRFVTSFGKKGSGPGEFKCPIGLAVDPCGVVYVCDADNNRVQVF